jgi:hypothetical protein
MKRSPKRKKPAPISTPPAQITPASSIADNYPYLVNVEKISNISGLSVSCLEKNRNKSGGVPYKRIGGRVLYCVRDVLAWIDSIDAYHPRKTQS